MAYRNIASVVKPVVEAMGYDCWGIQFSTYKRRALLRVFIDHADGISLDDCSSVSGQLSGVLDVENVINCPYTLEVSSPGLERPLLECGQYRRYIGAKIKVHCHTAIDNRKKIAGVLKAVSDEMIKLKVDAGCIEVPFTEISRANLIYDEYRRGRT